MQTRESYDLAIDHESNILADSAVGVVQWGAASLIDLGSTIYNSLAPEQYERSTYDNISAFSDDLATFYTDNRNAVELGSFVGGMIIPGLGVAKAAKAASSGAGFFGKIGKMGTLGYSENKIQHYTSTAAKLAKNANAETAAMKQATWKQRLWTVEKAAAENVLYEAAFYGLMNDHAYMDNYGVDTFFAGVALGTAIVSPIAIAVGNKSLRDAKATFQDTEAFQASLWENLPKDAKAVAGQGNVGAALGMSWYATNNLTEQANNINRASSPDMHTFLRNISLKQESNTQDIALSLLSKEAQLSSKITQKKGDTVPQRWWELRKTEPSTALQMIGHLTANMPTALDGAVRGGISAAKEYLNDIGTITSVGSKSLPRHDVGDLGEIGRTYDEAITYLGGSNFTENTSIVHMYQWGGQVEMASAVEGRLLRRTGDEASTFNKSYSFGKDATRTYDPIKQSVAQADGEMLSALSAVRTSSALIDPLDLPRLNAIVAEGQGVKLSTASGIGSKSVDAADVPRVLAEAKMHWIQEMSIKGYDEKQISISTNTPMDTVNGALFASSNPAAERAFLSNTTIDWAVYKSTSSEDIARHLVPTMHTIKMDPALRKPWATGAAYDKDLITNASRVAVEQTVQMSQSPMLRGIYEATAGKATSRTLEENLYQLYSTARAGSIYTSADMQLRAFDSINATVVTMGDDVNKIIREEGLEGIIGTVQPLMEAVANDGRAAIVNFEQLRNALDGIPSGQGIASNLEFEVSTGKVITKKDLKNPSNTEYLSIPGTNQDWTAEYTSVSSLVESGILPAGKSLWDMRETTSQLLNVAPSGKRGIYIPPNNPTEEFIAFVFNKKNPQDIKQISGKNKADMEQRIADIRPSLAPDYEVITRHTMEATWNKLHDYSALNSIREADSGMTKKGIPSHLITGSPQVLDDILKGYQAEVYKQARIFNRAANPNIFSSLESLANQAEELGKSAKGTAGQKVQLSSSPAQTVAKTLLNVSRTGESFGMSVANNTTDIAFSVARDHIQDLSRIVKDRSTKGKTARKAAWVEFTEELAQHNIPNPFKDIHEFIQASVPQSNKQAIEVVSAASQVMATLNLRLADTAHAIVTTLSSPTLILTEAASVGEKNPMKHFRAVGKYFLNPAANPEMDAVRKTMAEKGYGVRHTAEVTDMMRNLSSETSLLDHLADLDVKKVGDVAEKLKSDPSLANLGNTAYKVLTRPSDFSEEITREFAYLVGYEISKSQHALSTAAVHEEAANLFVKRAMGNYSARQRSVLFQGSFGQAMGLYQTFMMTIGQNMLRAVEGKNTKALATFFGTYTPMFGMESLPFYADLNTFTGNWLSAPDHQDISQTVYEAFGNKYSGHERSVGEYLLYGAPSALFQSAWYTRGDLDPRVPIDKGRLAPPVFTAIADLYQTATATAQNSYKLMQVGAPLTDVGRAMVEGITTQHMWRPAARLAELGLGYSIDRKGEVIAQQEEVRGSFGAVMTRLSGARPLKEAVLRQQRYYNKAYDVADTQRRRAYVRALRTHLATDGTSSSAVGDMMQGYMRAGGTPTGWGAVLNKTYLSTSVPMSKRLESEVKQQEGILAIIEGYSD